MPLKVSNKSLADYAAEAAWREDVRHWKAADTPAGDGALGGLSNLWCGYAQGEHREEKLLVEGNAPTKPRERNKW